MKQMRLRRTYVAIMILILLSMNFTNSFEVKAQGSVWTENMKVTYTGGSKTITVVWANMNNNKIRIESVLAEGKIGATDSLASIVQSASNTDGYAIGGINGSFFNAYADMQPSGTLMSAGEVLHIANTGSVLAITGNNEVSVDPLYVQILGGSNGQWDWPYSWYAWNINHYYTDAAATMIFTPEYAGPKPSHDFTAIEVDKGIVTKISKGSFSIPAEGFLVLTKDTKVIDVFEVGQEAAYKTDYYVNNYSSTRNSGVTLNYEQIRTVIGAGPTLVKDGKLKADAAAEGFTEGKITTNAATRSLIGVTADGKLGMAVVAGVTIKQLGEIALALGMVEAMNLDGGGSSGLYYNGSYLATPGRELSNAVVIKSLYEDPIRILLNTKPLFFDTEPYLNKIYNRTLVPLRGITEALGAKVGWNPTTSSVTVERYGVRLELKVGSSTVLVNGKSEIMDVPVTMKDGRTYVPLRFITQYFGGDVKWIEETDTIELTIQDIEEMTIQAKEYMSAQKYSEAQEVFTEILKLDSKNIYAAKELARIYASLLPDKMKAIEYYELVYALDPLDAANVSSLAWSYSGNLQLNEAIDMFLVYAQLLPNSGVGYYGAAGVYSHYQIQDTVSAIKYYELALTKELNAAQIEYAEAYLEKYKE